MLSDFTGAEKVYICCGYTDLRQGIDGLSALVRLEFDLDPFSNTLFSLKLYRIRTKRIDESVPLIVVPASRA